MNPMDYIRYEFGSIKDFATLFQIRPNTVALWTRNGIPIKYIKDIEKHTEGRLTKEMLRPDLFKKD